MGSNNVIQFQSFNVSLCDALDIVKYRLEDDTISIQTKVLAIEKVANMVTHNSIKKAELVVALRWMFKYYDFEA